MTIIIFKTKINNHLIIYSYYNKKEINIMILPKNMINQKNNHILISKIMNRNN